MNMIVDGIMHWNLSFEKNGVSNKGSNSHPISYNSLATLVFFHDMHHGIIFQSQEHLPIAAQRPEEEETIDKTYLFYDNKNSLAK